MQLKFYFHIFIHFEVFKNINQVCIMKKLKVWHRFSNYIFESDDENARTILTFNQ